MNAPALTSPPRPPPVAARLHRAPSLLVAGLIAALGVLAAPTAQAADVRFALVIGWNQADDSELEPLRYADDDALRYYELFSAKQLARRPYRSARDARPDLPSWVDGALEKAVRPDPARRYTVETELLYDLSHPNVEFSDQRRPPLLERNPTGFWRAVALLSLLANVVLSYWLHRG